MGNEFSRSHRRLHTPSDTFVNFHRWIHMSNQEYWVFTRGGIYPFLLYPTHVFFISFFFYATVRLILDVVPFYRAHYRTPNTESIYHVLTTYHRTLNTVSIYQPCTHTHLMQCPCAYAMQDAISCYIMSHS